VVGGRLCTDLVDVTSDLAALDSEGFWAVVMPYDGRAVCARFANVRPAVPWPGAPWRGPSSDSWVSSLDRDAYCAGVTAIREHIAAGEVYQVNLTRVLRAPLPDPAPGTSTDVAALGAALAVGNPAPFSAVVRLPDQGVAIASASPERFLSRRGDRVRSSPIKGTAAAPDGFTAKDRAENVMIVDLVRNDLARVCRPESVRVESLCRLERYRYVQHLVSIVAGRLRAGLGPLDALEAAIPGGSVTGAPKHRACEIISQLEGFRRGCYCGSLGYLGFDGSADWNLLIRTFVIAPGGISFAAGGGITAASVPEDEYAESLHKAEGMLRVLDALGIAGGADG
jgi:para-aminobenzoate synthetase component 1